MGSGQLLGGPSFVAPLGYELAVAGRHEGTDPEVDADLSRGRWQRLGWDFDTTDAHEPAGSFALDGNRFGHPTEWPVQTELHGPDTKEPETPGALVELPASSVLPLERVEAGLRSKARISRLPALLAPATESREGSVETFERPPTDHDAAAQQFWTESAERSQGPALVYVADGTTLPAPRSSSLLQRSVVQLALEGEQRLKGHLLTGGRLEKVAKGSAASHEGEGTERVCHPCPALLPPSTTNSAPLQ